MPEQIKAIDLLNPDVIKELQRVNTELVKVSTNLTALMTAMIKADEVLKKGATTQKELGDNVKKTNDNSQKLSDVEKEIQKIEEKHYQVLTKMVAARSDENKKTEEAVKQAKLEKLSRDAAVNSINGLVAANKKLRDERNNLIISDKNYQKNLERLNAEINKNDKAILQAGSDAEKQRGNIGNYKSAWEGVTSTFVAVTGVLASLGITWKLYHNILATSHTQLEQFEAMMKGVEFATKVFYKTLRTGAPDFETFIKNMGDAYKRGKEYEEGLQAIEKRQQAINFVRGEEKQKLAELDETIRDKSKSNDERLRAGLEVEERLNKGYEQEKELRKQNVEVELKALNLKGKTIEQAKEIIKQYLREDAFQPKLREDAEALNLILAEKEQTLKNINAAAIGQRDPRAVEAVKVQKIALQTEIDLIKQRNDSTGKYAALIRELEGERGKTRVDKTIEAIQKETEAENAFYYENKRIINTINGLKATAADDDKKREDEKIKLKEKRLKQEWDIEVERLNNEYKGRDIELSDFKKKEKEKEDAKKLGLKNDWDRALEGLNNEYKKNDIELKDFQDKEKKKREEIQLTRDLQTQLLGEAFGLFMAISDGEIAKLEEQRDKEIAGAGTNAKKKERIEADFAKKIAAEKRKQAIADKLASLFEITIATAVNIAKVATNPYLIALVAAIGALQTATVIAQPIPKFFKGVENLDKDTLAIVGDKFGREIIKTKEGNMFLTPDVATQMVLPKGADVITNKETEKMLAGGLQSSQVDVLIKEQRATRKMLASKPTQILNITERGWDYSTETSTSKLKWVDKYMRN